MKFNFKSLALQFLILLATLVFGGFNKQDVAKISTILSIGTYSVGIIVLLILFLIVLRASYKLKIDLKYNYYFFTASILC
jgi:hypothetical protein